MNASDNTGLGLFDDTASAVGNFPTALRGYDRTAVDDYVRTLEESVVKSRRHATQLEQKVTMLQDEVASAGDGADSKEVDYANLGGRANDILRLAQEQARELVQNATLAQNDQRPRGHTLCATAESCRPPNAGALLGLCSRWLLTRQSAVSPSHLRVTAPAAWCQRAVVMINPAGPQMTTWSSRPRQKGRTGPQVP